MTFNFLTLLKKLSDLMRPSLAVFLFAIGVLFVVSQSPAVAGPIFSEVQNKESIFDYISRTAGSFDSKLFKQILGAAADYKEGDETIGVNAADGQSRARARLLLSNTKILDLIERGALPSDEQEKIIRSSIDQRIYSKIKNKTIGELRILLLSQSEENIKKMMSLKKQFDPNLILNKGNLFYESLL